MLRSISLFQTTLNRNNKKKIYHSKTFIMQTQELTTTSILSLFDTTKDERRSFVIDLLSRIEDGNVNPLDIHVQIKCIEDIIEQLTNRKDYPESSKRYYENLLSEVKKHGKKFEYHQAKVEEKEVGTKYDWEKCEDPVIESLMSQEKALKEKIKARQEFLKTVPEKGLTFIDETSGEVTTIYRPAKSSTTSIAVSLK